jgi:plasmid stabilization system protein ParE
MSRRLILRPEAEAEMTGAFDWYEQRLPGLGSGFLRCVDAVFNAILRNPQQWPHVASRRPAQGLRAQCAVRSDHSECGICGLD